MRELFEILKKWVLQVQLSIIRQMKKPMRVILAKRKRNHSLWTRIFWRNRTFRIWIHRRLRRRIMLLLGNILSMNRGITHWIAKNQLIYIFSHWVLGYQGVKRNLVWTFLIIRLCGLVKMMIEELFQSDATEVQAIMKSLVLRKLISKNVNIFRATYFKNAVVKSTLVLAPNLGRLLKKYHF